MGWLYTQIHQGDLRTAGEINTHISSLMAQPLTATQSGYEVLASAVRGKVWYGVIRYTHYEHLDDPRVSIGVVLWDRRPGEFGYKDMDESMGPYYYDCPARLLKLADMLGPVAPDSDAGKWRAACRAHATKKAAQRQVRAGFKPGDTVRIQGAVPDTFTLSYPLPRGVWVTTPPVYKLTARHMARAELINPTN